MKVVNLISKTFFTLTIYIILSVERIFVKKVQPVLKDWTPWKLILETKYDQKKMRNHHKIKFKFLFKKCSVIKGWPVIISRSGQGDQTVPLLYMFFLDSQNMFAFVEWLITWSEQGLFDSMNHSENNLFNKDQIVRDPTRPKSSGLTQIVKPRHIGNREGINISAFST